MDLNEEWKNMNGEWVEKSSSLKINQAEFDHEAKGLVQDLLFKLEWKMRWVRIIDVPILIGAFYFEGELRLLLLFVFFCYELSLYFAKKEFIKIKIGVDYDKTVLQVLQSNLSAVKGILRIENLFAYLYLPISAPIGWLALQLHRYGSIEKVIEAGKFNMHVLLIWLVISGLGLLVGRWMNHSIFNSPIKNLQSKIDDLIKIQ